MWRRQIPNLVEAGYRCIVPDLRGHGDSEEPGDFCDIAEHLQDIEDTLSHVDVNFPATFIGHSLGSIISVELAERRPELFQKILAVALPGKVPAMATEAFRAFLKLPYHTIRGTPLHHSLDWRTKVMIETNRHSLEQIALNFGGINYAEKFPKVTCPLHFAVGRLDPVAPCVYVEQMHRMVPGSTLKVIEWAGHNCMDSQPQAFNEWLFEKLNDEAKVTS